LSDEDEKTVPVAETEDGGVTPKNSITYRMEIVPTAP